MFATIQFQTVNPHSDMLKEVEETKSLLGIDLWSVSGSRKTFESLGIYGVTWKLDDSHDSDEAKAG